MSVGDRQLGINRDTHRELDSGSGPHVRIHVVLQRELGLYGLLNMAQRKERG